MSEAGLGRPQPSEYHPFYETYVSKVPEERILPVLEAQPDEVRRFLGAVPESRGGHRYAEGKWSVRQVVGHVADSERLFTYRALCFARGERQALPGFDEDAYAAEAGFDAVPLRALVDELLAVRQATLHFYRHLPDGAWTRGGTANGKALTVRSLAYIMAGHLRHHLGTLRERYGL